MPTPDVTATAVGSMYTTSEQSMFGPWPVVGIFGGASLLSLLLLGAAARKPTGVRIAFATPFVFGTVALVISETLRARQHTAPAPAKPKPASWVMT